MSSFYESDRNTNGWLDVQLISGDGISDLWCVFLCRCLRIAPGPILPNLLFRLLRRARRMMGQCGWWLCLSWIPCWFHWVRSHHIQELHLANMMQPGRCGSYCHISVCCSGLCWLLILRRGCCGRTLGSHYNLVWCGIFRVRSFPHWNMMGRRGFHGPSRSNCSPCSILLSCDYRWCRSTRAFQIQIHSLRQRWAECPSFDTGHKVWIPSHWSLRGCHRRLLCSWRLEMNMCE